MRALRWIGTGVLLASLSLAAGAGAQSLSNACQTQFGVCFAPVAPVGAPCVCGPGHPGRMIYAPQQAPVQAAPPLPPPGRLGTACGTRFGVCQASPAPLGSPCVCYGPRGPDAGQIFGGQ